MNHADALDIIADLKAIWPRQDLQDGTIKAYIDNLVDLDFETVKTAVSALARSSKFVPSIAEIRESVAERSLSVPSPADAWHEVQTRVNDYDEYDDERKWPKWSHDLVRTVVLDLGGLRTLYYSSMPSADRAHFFRLYGEHRKDLIERAAVGELSAPADNVRTLPSGDKVDPEAVAALRTGLAKSMEA